MSRVALVRRLLLCAAGLAICLGLQVYWSWPRARGASDVFLDTRPAGATVWVRGAELGRLQGGEVKGGFHAKPVGTTPGPLQLDRRRPYEVSVTLWGYEPVPVLRLAPDRPPEPVVLTPRWAVIVPTLYFLRDWCFLVVGLGMLLAAVRSVVAWRRLQGARQRERLALQLGELSTGVSLGPYRLGQRLGQGAMAQVFKAVREGEREPVAVKILSQRLSRDPAQVAVFLREIEILRGLRHPNLPYLLDWGEAFDFQYVVMEWVDGATLAEEMRQGSVAPARVLDWARQICRGLQHAHRSGIVHRDLKPSNLMQNRSGVVKIMDFGIAMREGRKAESDHAGTPAYMAPEQLRGASVDWRADYYALGVILYEASSGQRFVPGAPALAGLPSAMADVVGQLLEVDPARRARDKDQFVCIFENLEGAS